MEVNSSAILIGKRIKSARENAGITQCQLHDLTGISITQISAYENGNRNIGLVSLKKIANAIGTSMDDLYDGKREEKLITTATNEGKLIVNCVTALFERGVIKIIPRENRNEYVQIGYEYYYQIGFDNYVEIIDDYVKKLVDFENNIENYSKPDDFKTQLMEATSNKINNVLSCKNALIRENFWDK